MNHNDPRLHQTYLLPLFCFFFLIKRNWWDGSGKYQFWKVSVQGGMFWVVLVLGHISSGRYQFWKVTVLGGISSGRNEFWNVWVLEGISSGRYQLWNASVLGDISSGRYPFWKVSVMGGFISGRYQFWKISLQFWEVSVLGHTVPLDRMWSQEANTGSYEKASIHLDVYWLKVSKFITFTYSFYTIENYNYIMQMSVYRVHTRYLLVHNHIILVNLKCYYRYWWLWAGKIACILQQIQRILWLL